MHLKNLEPMLLLQAIRMTFSLQKDMAVQKHNIISEKQTGNSFLQVALILYWEAVM
jgi:hypothetical protein